MRISLFLAGSILFFSSCEKDELPVKPYDRGNAQVASVDMTQDYRYQVYFKLNTNSIVKTQLKTEWDLSFDCSAEDHIFLNSAKSMFLWNTGKTDFASVTDTTGFENNKIWDRSSGNRDSTAFGNLATNTGTVYLLDRGYNETGGRIGYKKLQVLSIAGDEYTIRYANVNGTEEQTRTVRKNTAYNTVSFSFNTNTDIEGEPFKNSYDLSFTQYTYTFVEPYQPYLVTGVLQNTSGVRVAIDATKDFRDITINDTLNYTFSSAADQIGYNWKFFNFSTGTYTVHPEINYIIQDIEGFFYKLHFIDFYNSEGKKGSPKFEFQKL